jgi:2-octaprenyl-6-methoxyphenol hydroxylase
MLTDYETLRSSDQKMMLQFTDGLIRLFTSNHLGLKLARRMGLMAFDQLPVFKSVLSRYARGFAGVTPDLVCGIPLQYNPMGEVTP